MFILLLLMFLGLVIFFVTMLGTTITAIVGIVAGMTTITILASVWLGTSYYLSYSLKKSGNKPETAQETYRQVDSDLKQIVGDLQEIRSELEAAESHLRNMEFLKYARQNS